MGNLPRGNKMSCFIAELCQFPFSDPFDASHCTAHCEALQNLALLPTPALRFTLCSRHTGSFPFFLWWTPQPHPPSPCTYSFLLPRILPTLSYSPVLLFTSYLWFFLMTSFHSSFSISLDISSSQDPPWSPKAELGASPLGFIATRHFLSGHLPHLWATLWFLSTPVDYTFVTGRSIPVLFICIPGVMISTW